MELDHMGAAFIKSQEGLELIPYEDGAGVWTVGYGHTEGVTRDTPVINEAQAESFFWDDIEPIEQLLNDEDLVRVTLTQNEYNALCSFIFNEGEGAFVGSTLLKKLNSGDKLGAAKELDKWVYFHNAQGVAVKSQDLIERRAEEKELFLMDVLAAKDKAEN